MAAAMGQVAREMRGEVRASHAQTHVGVACPEPAKRHAACNGATGIRVCESTCREDFRPRVCTGRRAVTATLGMCMAHVLDFGA